MCGVIVEDFVRPLIKKPLSEGQASFYMKLITVFVGVLCTLLAFVVDQLGGLIQVWLNYNALNLQVSQLL